MRFIANFVAYAIFKYEHKDGSTLKNELQKFVQNDTETMRIKNTKCMESEDASESACVYFVSDRSDKKSFDTIKEDIQKKTGAETFVQIIGSSTEFKSKVATRLEDLLMEYLDDFDKRKTVLVYGVTGEGVNSAVNGILESNIDYRRLVVGNLVGRSFNYMDIDFSALPGHLTYLFDMSDKSRTTEFGEDNKLADALSDWFIVVGGGNQSFDQINDALKVEKSIYVVTSKEENVHNTNRISAGDIITAAKKAWQDSDVVFPALHKDLVLDERLRADVRELLSRLNPKVDFTDPSQKHIVEYLATWRREGYLKRLVIFEEV